MAIAVEALLRLIDDELDRVSDPDRRRLLRSLLRAPVVHTLAWDYGFLDERHDVWIIGRNDTGEILLAYSDVGFGPAFPWGWVVAAEDSAGMDAQWHSGLEDAAIGGRLIDPPRGYSVPGPRGGGATLRVATRHNRIHRLRATISSMPNQPRITEITWKGPHSTLVLRRSVPGVVVLVITGTDVGEHGTGPFEELAKDVRSAPFVLFVDARNSRGVTIDVSSEWCQWLSRNRHALREVHMLTGSPFVHVTATFVRNFAELTDLMRIYTHPADFERALSAAQRESAASTD